MAIESKATREAVEGFYRNITDEGLKPTNAIPEGHHVTGYTDGVADYEPEGLPYGRLRVRRTSEYDGTDKLVEFVLTVDNPGGPIVERVLHDVVPRTIELFLQKAADYTRDDGVNWSEFLGEKAQFVDIFRKIGKLHGAMWEGRPLAGEPVEEILMDLIGHCLLILEERTRTTRLELKT